VRLRLMLLSPVVARLPWGGQPSAARGALGAALAGGLLASCALAGAAAGTHAHAAFPATSARVTLDVIDTLQHGQADTQTPAGVSRAVQPPYLEPQAMQVGTERRRWLYMHPTSEVAVRLRVPSGAYFQSGLALNPEAWT